MSITLGRASHACEDLRALSLRAAALHWMGERFASAGDSRGERPCFGVPLETSHDGACAQ